MFVDDTGNVDRVTDNTPKLRFGAVAAVIMPMAYVESTFDRAFHSLAEKHFGLDPTGKPFVLHRRALVKPTLSGPFAPLLDKDKKASFDAHCMKMYEAADYTVITAAVDKVAFYYRYPNWDGDFYAVLVEALI